jgi:hypothetical protein
MTTKVTPDLVVQPSFFRKNAIIPNMALLQRVQHAIDSVSNAPASVNVPVMLGSIA